MDRGDFGTSFEDSPAGWDAKPIKPVVRRKRTKTLCIGTVISVADSLFGAEENVRQTGDNVFHWR